MKKFIYIILIAIILGSCEKAFLADEPENTPMSNFESMWKTLDQKYSFFALKEIDWDSVYTVYKSRIREEMNQEELFDVLADMLFELRDGHVNLKTNFDRSRNWDWFLDKTRNFDYNLILDHYLGKNYRFTGPLINQVIDSVGYIYYGSFGSSISSANIDFLIHKFSGLKGIIIDVRSNGGGSTSNGSLLVSRFITEEQVFQKNKYKIGPGHEDFSEPEAITVSPGGERQFTKPVAVLTNAGCYSATNMFASYMSQIPHVALIGDTTGGGGGYPFYSQLPNGWIYRYSGTRSYRPDGLNLELGIPPDIRIDMLEEDILEGKDSILERALQWIREGGNH